MQLMSEFVSSDQVRTALVYAQPNKAQWLTVFLEHTVTEHSTVSLTQQQAEDCAEDWVQRCTTSVSTRICDSGPVLLQAARGPDPGA